MLRRKVEFRRVTIIALGTAAAMALVAAAFHLVPAIDAARGQGSSGTFVFGYQTCSVRTTTGSRIMTAGQMPV